jgi:hypothetical protein
MKMSLRPLGLWDPRSKAWIVGPTANYDVVIGALMDDCIGCVRAASRNGVPRRLTKDETADLWRAAASHALLAGL